MNAVHRHRGPDEAGEYRDPEAGVALASARLSIIDIAGGRQPMSNEDGSILLVYNGAVYNAPGLRRWLELRGHRFRTSHSDTEVLVHLYEEKQEAMLDDLNGMFAFVIYDRTRGVLFGARDRLGIKPLYYVERPEFFGFASELKSLLVLPDLPREVNPLSLFHYMSLSFVPGEWSILQGVRRLCPGHWFRYDLRTRALTVQQYWDLDLQAKEPTRSEREWAELVRWELRESVRRRMLSDVPVGCSLSGGIDSSTIVGLLGEMGYSKIKTYSLGFAGPGEEEWNELPLARQVADRWGTEHHELILDPDQLLEDLVQMVWHLDEPYGGGLPSWYVFKFMRDSVTVGLTGTGGDELFGSYGRYRFVESSVTARWLMTHRDRLRAEQAWMNRLWSPVAALVSIVPGRWLDGRQREQIMRLARLPSEPLRRYYFNILYQFPDSVKRERVFEFGKNIPDTALLLQELYDRAGTGDIRDGIAYVDFKTQLPDEFLHFTDRLSMAHSIEARVPFLDHTFVELMFRIPASLRTRPDDVKYLLRRAVGDLLPDGVLGARKRGFVIPIALWLRHQLRPLVERLLSPDRLQRQGVFQPAFYRLYVEPHFSGQADHTWKIWTALMFQLWHLVFIEEHSEGTPGFVLKDLLV
jgi:asparagine synthase (glutamine-hydrolysing)